MTRRSALRRLLAFFAVGLASPVASSPVRPIVEALGDGDFTIEMWLPVPSRLSENLTISASDGAPPRVIFYDRDWIASGSSSPKS